MYLKEKLSRIIEQYIRHIEFPADPDSLYGPISYSLESGGKRVRPLLTMMVCDIFGGNLSEAVPCAVAVEVFHNFTLLHDDIMDNAAMRRGKPAVHRRWGGNSAILSGDAMMIFSYKLLEKADARILPSVLSVFNDVSLKVCEGQQYDMDFELLENVSIEEYLRMIELKTAALMAGASAIGALCGGASKDDCAHLYTFGNELGVAFQIQDDLLDSFGSEQILGKKIGGDIMEGKKTFLTIAALQSADDATRAELVGLMHNKEAIPQEKIAGMLKIYDRLKIRTMAEEAVEYYTKRAIAALDSVPVDPARLEPIRELALELTKRIN